MRLKIVQAGEPVLRQAARALTDKEIRSDEIQRLIRDMHETMTDAPGVGLAAPQVGLGIQLAMIEDREDLLKSVTAEDLAEKERRSVPFHVIINPKRHARRRRARGILRRLPKPCWFYGNSRASAPRPRGLPRRRCEAAYHRSIRLVRAHPAARNRSSPWHALHRPHAPAHFHPRSIISRAAGKANRSRSSARNPYAWDSRPGCRPTKHTSSWRRESILPRSHEGRLRVIDILSVELLSHCTPSSAIH